MKRFFIFVILIITLISLYAFYIEPNNLKANEYIITSDKINSNYDGLKIIHFSDTLYNNKLNEENIKKLINSINEVNPDVIFFTGDLINKKVNDHNKELIIKYFKDLNAKYYKYAILGDLDSNISSEILTSSDFKILDNSKEYLFINDNTPLEIDGGNDFDKINNDENITVSYKIAIIHKPDYAKNINENYDLILAGHSLGGQIRLPFYKTIINFDGAKEYTSEYHEFENSIMYVSYGIGARKYNVRLFNIPSFNIYRLESK